MFHTTIIPASSLEKPFLDRALPRCNRGEMFKNELAGAKTVIWNGPLGLSEFKKFAVGTDTIAKFLGDMEDVTTIIGGGDSAAAIERMGIGDKFTHISTGGGASLEFLEGKKLPGVECLLNK